MKKPRGNRKSRAEIANRHKEVVAFLADGLTPEQIAAEVGASRRTIFRDLEVLNEQVAELPVTLEKFTAYRERQRQELERLKRVVIESDDFNDRDRVAALLKINESLTALLCLDSEKLIEKTMPSSGGGNVILQMNLIGPDGRPQTEEGATAHSKRLQQAALDMIDTSDIKFMEPALPIAKQMPSHLPEPTVIDADLTIDQRGDEYDATVDEEGFPRD